MSALFTRITAIKNKPRTIRFQLLLSVNITLSIALICLLILQYHREMQNATDQMRTGLNDESIAIQSAVSHLIEDHGHGDVQGYIDRVCSEMRKSASPGHQIIVSMHGTYLKAGGSSPESESILSHYDFSKPNRFNGTNSVNTNLSSDINLVKKQVYL